MLLAALVFILVLGILVLVHELGHFTVAKLTGMQVEEFGIGFPPRLAVLRRRGTRYCLNLIPLGGYVKIKGENPEDSTAKDPDSFQNRPIAARIAVIVAGVVMNLLFAFVVLTVAFSVGFISVSQSLTQIKGAKLISSQVIVADVFPSSPAATAHLQPGDLIIQFKDPATGKITPITSINDVRTYTVTRQEQKQLPVSLLIDRNGKRQEVTTTLNPEGAPLGIAIDSIDQVRVPVLQAPRVALKEMSYIIQVTWQGLKTVASKLFVHGKLDQSVSGPVGVYKATASAAQEGVMQVIFLGVVLSINLALFNILPIPALDGGRLLFLLIEAAFGKRVIAERIENALSLVGIALLILFTIVVTFKDIKTLF